MTEPYYQDDSVTIYHGDCREIIPQLSTEQIDLILTDPPYGINHPTDFAHRGRGQKADTHDWNKIVGDGMPFDPSFLLAMNVPTILWGGIYYTDKLPISSGWLIWDKRTINGKGVNDQADGELAWTNCIKGVRILRHMWNGFWKDSERGESYHPMQKPVALMRWCLSFHSDVICVLDPFMGSGPVLRACKDVGIPAIGIEIEEAYCEIAAKRMSQLAMAL